MSVYYVRRISEMKTISTEQIAERVKRENPWWEDPKGMPAFYSQMTPRPYLNLLVPLVEPSSVRRAVVLMGPRRVGKTVMIHHMIQRLVDSGVSNKKIAYFSVDNPVYNDFSLEDFLRYFKDSVDVNIDAEKCYVFFDEIQYLKNWEQHLKSLVDSYPTVQFLVSGSAAAALKLKSTESGAGRFTDFLLPPLTFYEYLDLLGVSDIVDIEEQDYTPKFSTEDIMNLNNHFVEYINFGGYPEAIFAGDIQSDPKRFIKNDIIDKVLLRDLPSLYGIRDVQELNSLFTTLAFNTAGEVSLSELSRSSGVAKNTIKKYIEYLEAAFLIRTVHRVDNNAKRFKRANTFKIYLAIPSIRSALFYPVRSESEEMGALVETAIFSQWFHAEIPLFYARWRSGEVDIVHLNNHQKIASCAEIKWSDRYLNKFRELTALIDLCNRQKVLYALVTSKTVSGSYNIGKTQFDITPASLYCFGLGYNIIRRK